MKRLKLRTAAALAVIVPLSAAAGTPPAESQDACVEWSDWSEPVNLLGVNSPFNEQNPFLSRDELTLYFTSVRPGGHGNLDLWVAQRRTRNSDWGPAMNLPAPINTAANDLAPNLSPGEHLLFFASDRAGGLGSFDIYVARGSVKRDALRWDEPVNLGSPINTADVELAPFYFHGALYFNRGAQQLQLADIYLAALNRDPNTNVAVPVVELNSPMNDSAITIRRDGREVFFWSQRAGSAGGVDIWTSTRHSVHHPWSVPINVGAPINSDSVDATPNLSWDGRTMIFASNRAGGLGGNDLWISTRTPVEHGDRHLDSRRCNGEALESPE